MTPNKIISEALKKHMNKWSETTPHDVDKIFEKTVPEVKERRVAWSWCKKLVKDEKKEYIKRIKELKRSTDGVNGYKNELYNLALEDVLELIK